MKRFSKWYRLIQTTAWQKRFCPKLLTLIRPSVNVIPAELPNDLSSGTEIYDANSVVDSNNANRMIFSRNVENKKIKNQLPMVDC